ncbi:hypothetical protein FNV43_RR01773 [Rhamnella rubrinervis]|uniref:N-acetyltransferase domain-containing protein n=1 Tax=Rhamnella rubrinervis TaxID=2594499 RepID=A0A8K0MSC6_9ROSA|nr:hypothetical protein FNV43_RR01773 [Rhamnella rubrinervis]
MATNSLEICTLRPFRISDADDFLIYAGDEKVTRFSRLKTLTSKEEAISQIQNVFIPHPYFRSICINDRSIGYVFFKPMSGDDKRRAEVGYVLAKEYWGQGIVTRVTKMAICDGFKEFPDVVRMQAHVEVDNKASQRVLEKIGFQREAILRKYTYNKGEIKDLVMYGLLSTDPML